MKILLTIILLSITNCSLLGQRLINEVIFSEKSDTIFWYNYKNQTVQEYDLGFIENKWGKRVFRLWDSYIVLEVSQNDRSFMGTIDFIVNNRSKNENEPKIYKKTFQLSDSISRVIFIIIDTTNINSLPSSNKINGWRNGLDGTEYLLEYKENSDYTFRNYWTPSSQENILEAILLQGFVDKLYDLCRIKELRKDFNSGIPFESWNYEGTSMGGTKIKRMTKKQYRKYKRKKERKKRQLTSVLR